MNNLTRELRLVATELQLTNGKPELFEKLYNLFNKVDAMEAKLKQIEASNKLRGESVSRGNQ
jgi:hypothetical protein